MKKNSCLTLIVVIFASFFFSYAYAAAENNAPAKVSAMVIRSSESGKTIDQENIKRGGTLVFRRVGITNIDPTQCIAAANDKMVLGIFFETLLWMSDEDYSLQPNLATEWKYSEDGMAFEIKLREDALFSDGTPVNAESVVKTWEFVMDPETAHLQAGLAANVSSVEATDNYSVRFNFSEPDSGFANALTQPIGYVYAPAAIEEFKKTKDPQTLARKGGSGPFVLAELLEGESYTAVANPNYYRVGEDGQPLPYLNSIIVQVVGDETVMAANVQSGSIDVVDFFSTKTQVEALKADPNVTVKNLPSYAQYFLYLNTTKAPFDDIKVREAIQYAFDREELSEIISMGDAIITPTIVLPNQSYYNPNGTIYPYDPEKAKSLLSEAGYPDGVTVELYYATYGSLQSECELLQAQAKDAGFNLKLVGVDGATLKQIWALENEDTPAGMRLQDLFNPKASPYVQFEYAFGPTALQNCSKWLDPEFQELLARIRPTTDETARNELLFRMQEIIGEQLPICNLQSAARYACYRNWVKGLHYDGDGAVNFTQVWLDK